MRYASSPGAQAAYCSSENADERKYHSSEVATATGMPSVIASFVCTFISDETAPELTNISIHQIAKLLDVPSNRWNKWYSKSQFAEIVDINEAISLVKECIRDLNSTLIEASNDEPSVTQHGQVIPSHKIFSSLYRQYLNALPPDYKESDSEFRRLQNHRFQACLAINYKTHEQYRQSKLAFIHLCLTAFPDPHLIWQALFNVALVGNTDLIKTVLAVLPCNSRFDILMKADALGWTTLHCAAFNGHCTTANRILAALQNDTRRFRILNATTHDGRSSMMFAARSGSISTVHTLLQAAASDEERLAMLEARDNRGHSAIEHSFNEEIKQMIMCIKSELQQSLSMNTAPTTSAASRTAPAASHFGRGYQSRQANTPVAGPGPAANPPTP